MAKFYDTGASLERNERKKAKFAELYGKKPSKDSKAVNFPTKFTKFGEIEEKPIKSAELESFYNSVDRIRANIVGEDPPVSDTNPNAVFKAKKREKTSNYTPIDWGAKAAEIADKLCVDRS